MRVLPALTSLFALAASLAPRTVRAQASEPWTQGARLSWVRSDGAERCPDVDAIEARIRTRSGDDPFVTGPRRMIEATVRREHGVFTTHITVRDGSGTLLGARDLTSSAPDCEALARAAAVSISLSLAADIDEPAASSPPPTSVVAAPAPPIVDPETARLAPPPLGVVTPRVPSQWPALRDDVGVVGHIGLLPAPGVGVGIGTQMRLTRWIRVGLAFEHLPVQQFANAAGTYAFGLTYGQLDVCLETLGDRPATLAFCMGITGGGLSGFVIERQPLGYGELFWSAATLGARATIPIYGPVEAAFDLEGYVPITRYQFQLPGGSTFEQANFGGTVRISLGVRFP